MKFTLPLLLILCAGLYPPQTAAQAICEIDTVRTCVQITDTSTQVLTVPADIAAFNRGSLSLCAITDSYFNSADIVVLIDNSASMAATGDPKGLRGGAVKAFIEKVLQKDPSGNTRVAIVLFNSNVTNQPVFTKLNASNLGAIESQVVTENSGGTNYTDAFEKAIALFANSTKALSQRVIIFLTDGHPEDPDNPYLYKEEWDAFPTVHSVFLGTGKDYKDMQDISKKTNGQFFTITDAASLAAQLTGSILEDIFKVRVPASSVIRNVTTGREWTLAPGQHAQGARSGKTVFALQSPGEWELAPGNNTFVFKSSFSDGTTFNKTIQVTRSAGSASAEYSVGCRERPIFLVTDPSGALVSDGSHPLNYSHAAFGYALVNANPQFASVEVKITGTSGDAETRSAVPRTNSAAGYSWKDTMALQPDVRPVPGDGKMQTEDGMNIVLKYQNPYLSRDSAMVVIPVSFGPAVRRAGYYDLNGDGRVETVEIEFDRILNYTPKTLGLSVQSASGAASERVLDNGKDAFRLSQDRKTVSITLADPLPFGTTGSADGAHVRTYRDDSLLLRNRDFPLGDSTAPVIDEASIAWAKVGESADKLQITFSEDVNLADGAALPLVIRREGEVLDAKLLRPLGAQKTDRRHYSFLLEPSQDGLVVKAGDEVAIDTTHRLADLFGNGPSILLFRPVQGPATFQDLESLQSGGFATSGAAERFEGTPFLLVDESGKVIEGPLAGRSAFVDGIAFGNVIWIETSYPLSLTEAIYSKDGAYINRLNADLGKPQFAKTGFRWSDGKMPRKIYKLGLLWNGRDENDHVCGTGAYIAKMKIDFPFNSDIGAPGHSRDAALVIGRLR
jgi:uncharacterized protein YegL